MSKRRELERLAKATGVISPKLKYTRLTKMWSVQSEMPNPNGRGYIAHSVGSYRSLAEAKANLPTHWHDFQRRHGIGEFAPTDDHTPTDDAPTLPELPTPDDNITPDDTATPAHNDHTPAHNDHTRDNGETALNELLRQVIAATTGTLEIEINDALRQAAAECLEARTRKPRYKTTTPERPKARIRWKQPIARRSPVYQHSITCAVCGVPYAVQTHSPNAPATCDSDDCATEHNRALARERMRRYRQRKRGE